MFETVKRRSQGYSRASQPAGNQPVGVKVDVGVQPILRCHVARSPDTEHVNDVPCLGQSIKSLVKALVARLSGR